MNIHANKAASFVDRAAQSDAIDAIVTGIIEAGEVRKRGPLFLMVALQEAYGADMASFWRPGSTSDTSNNADKYENVVAGAKVKGSNIADFAMNTPKGLEIAKTLEAWKKAEKGEGVGAYASHSTTTVKQAVKRFGAQKTALIGAYRQAISLYHQMADIHDMGGMGCRFTMVKSKDKATGETVENISDTTVPMHVFDASDLPNSAMDRFQVMSVGQFLSLDVDKAKKTMEEKNVSAWEALINSSKKQGGGLTVAGKSVAKYKTADEFHNGLAAVANAFDDRNMYQTIIKTLAGKDSDWLVQTIGDLYIALQTNVFTPKIRARYENLNGNKLTDAA